MLLRVLGLIVLVLVFLSVTTFLFGVRERPEVIRRLGLDALLPSAGLLLLGFGLAFSSGVGRVFLVGAGIATYLAAIVLALAKRENSHGR
jgi:hypothetical protein